ncbi:MAG: hypothetical protein WAV64_01960 [Candidatus Moraniibacteriota bacterium]
MKAARPFTTPWVRDHLAAHPEQAMAVEALRRGLPEGSALSLFGRTWQGPYSATLYVPGGAQDGYRGAGPTVLAAVQSAVAQASAVAS